MATARAAEGPKRLICAVCLERYKRPKLLSCFHTFCEGCLSSLAPPPSPSFLCPACRVTVTVPPGGVTKFQSNFYIEEDIAREESRDKKKCEVCTSGHVALHKCVDCQQFYCAPCLATHNTFTVNQSHKVLTLSAEETTVDEPKSCEKCKLHPDQVKALYCKPCAQSICLLCKLTSHEGHASEDVLAASTRVRQQLHDMVATVRRRVREMEVEEEMARTIAENVQKEQTYAETELEKRKARLVEWAEQGCKDAVQTARAITTARVDSLKMKLEKASAARVGLVAKADHINLSLARGNHSELLQLQKNLKLETADSPRTQDMPRTSETATAKPLNDVDRESGTVTQSDGQAEGCSSEDRVPCLQLHWDDSALSHASLLHYIGQVVSVDSPCMMPLCSRIGTGAGMLASSVPSDASENAASSPTSIEDESSPTAQVNKAMSSTSEASSSTAKHTTELHQPSQSDTACEGPSLALHSSLTRNFLEVKNRNARSGAKEKAVSLVVPSALEYSENPSAEVLDICLTSSNKLWVRYKPSPSAAEMLVLLDSDGTHLGTWRENFPSSCTSLTSVGDVLVFLNSRGNKIIHYRSGVHVSYKVKPPIQSLTWSVKLDWFGPNGQHGSTDTPPVNVILFSQNSQPLYGVLYDESSQGYNVYRLTISSFLPLSITSDFILKSHLTNSSLDSFAVKSGRAVANFDVSEDGLFFVFLKTGDVTVYFKQEQTASLAFICKWDSQFCLQNPFFCKLGDQELLAVKRADQIVAMSYHDGLILKRETIGETIGSTDKMSAGRHGVVYIGKPGGRISVVKLNDI